MTRILPVLSALTLALAATACGSAADSSGTADDPTGRTFVSTAVEGTPIPGDGPLVLDFFEEDRLAATAGCNRFTGAVDLSDGVVHAPDLAGTLMACEPSREGADEWLRALLADAPRWTLTGDELTLTGGEVTVSLLDKKIVDPDRPIVGTEWTVTSLRTADAVTTSTALESASPTLVVAEDGTLSGTTGCNEFTGSAEVGTDVLLVLGPLTTTLAGCTDPELSDIERHVLAVLEGEVTFSIDGASMTLTAENRVDGMELIAR